MHGFGDVYRYVGGKWDWISNALPVEGQVTTHGHIYAIDVVRRDTPTCQLGERVGDIRARLDEAGQDTCVVLNEHDVVLGRLSRQRLDDAPDDTPVEGVMEIGPTASRPGTFASTLAERMRSAGVGSMLITNAEGQFVGVLHREDVEKALASAEKAGKPT